jgi:hypothetical protein
MIKDFMKEKKPVGAPRGNQNARKHGLYSRVLDENQKLQLDKARAVKGIDEEIAIMRVKLRTLLERYPEHIDLQLRAIATIARMVRTRFNINAALDDCFVPQAGPWPLRARKARRRGRG